MGVQGWTFLIIGLTFALYIVVAILSRARSTGEFYVAGKGVSPIANGMATAADWMSAASFISMGIAGLPLVGGVGRGTLSTPPSQPDTIRRTWDNAGKPGFPTRRRWLALAQLDGSFCGRSCRPKLLIKSSASCI